MQHDPFKAFIEPMRTLWRRYPAGLLIAILVTMPLHSTAQSSGPPSYDVELVIFRNLGAAGSPEQWAASNPIPAPGTDMEAAAPNAGESAFPKLPPERFKLSAIYDTLRRSRAYQPLAHVGWTQPGFDRDAAKFVSLGELGVDAGVTGRAALARGRYLHLTLDLSLQLPGEGSRYVLKQTRRMRSTEIHYIDHPRFGVVALVTPVAAG